MMPADLAEPKTRAVWKAEATREAAIARAERLASELTVARVAIRREEKVSSRNLARMREATRRARAAEAVLRAAQTRPAAVGRMLARLERLLTSYKADACPWCQLRGDHRPNCRRDRALDELHALRQDFEPPDLQYEIDDASQRRTNIKTVK